MLRLLNLPKDISNQVKEGALSSAHGRTLLGIKDVTMMKNKANKPYVKIGVLDILNRL